MVTRVALALLALAAVCCRADDPAAVPASAYDSIGRAGRLGERLVPGDHEQGAVVGWPDRRHGSRRHVQDDRWHGHRRDNVVWCVPCPAGGSAPLERQVVVLRNPPRWQGESRHRCHRRRGAGQRRAQSHTATGCQNSSRNVRHRKASRSVCGATRHTAECHCGLDTITWATTLRRTVLREVRAIGGRE